MSDGCDGKSAGSGASGIHGYGICKSVTLVAQLDADSRRYSEWGKNRYIIEYVRVDVDEDEDTKMHTSKELQNISIENKQPQTLSSSDRVTSLVRVFLRQDIGIFVLAN